MIKENFSILLTLISLSTVSYATTNFEKPAPWIGNDLKGIPCKQEEQGYGPYDYTKWKKYKTELELVESTHFHADIENLIDKTRHTGETFDDLDYTLRAWPNHPRALLSVIRYQVKFNNKLMRPIPLSTPPECYLLRAINFNKEDPVPVSLMAYYLSTLGKYSESVNYYEKALTLSPNNLKIEYSYSLLLIKLKNYEKALELAKKVYEHGNPPEGLRKELIKLGIWK